MSRRPNPAADRAAQNQATLKSLTKLESNKSCADCKRNKRIVIVLLSQYIHADPAVLQTQDGRAGT